MKDKKDVKDMKGNGLFPLPFFIPHVLFVPYVLLVLF